MNATITGPDPLVEADLPGGAALCAMFGWPHRPQDLRLAFDLGQGLALREGDRLVATAMGWPWGDRFATVGMIIVDRERQGLGLGGRIFDGMLNLFGTRSIILNATREGLELYRRRNFVEIDTVCQHQGVAGGDLTDPMPEGFVLAPIAPDDLGLVDELDRGATDMRRANLIERLLAEGEGLLLRGADGQARGYAMMRAFGRGHVIGPVVARDSAAAQLLVAAFLRRMVGSFVRVDTAIGSGLGDWLESHGLQQVDTVVTMVRGARPEPAGPCRVFALASQSLG